MPRKKISEYQAKNIVSKALHVPYQGISIDAKNNISAQLVGIQDANDSYVVKVDQAVKGRFKKGLVKLDVSANQISAEIDALKAKGYRWMLVEPMVTHQKAEERYLALSREREGIRLSYSEFGGVDVEDRPDSIDTTILTDDVRFDELATKTYISVDALQQLIRIFNETHMTFLEINPFIVNDESLKLLDLAVEVDSAGAFFTQEWTEQDFREPSDRHVYPEEQMVRELAAKSPASFKLDVINPNGSIFLLLSGGGASIVVADEVYNQGHGALLANYGEYSGNPNSEETQLYTAAVLQLLLNSQASRKVLFIGGAVANFTDIAQTFKGVIAAIDKVAHQLKEQSIKVYVRRGGPHQDEGLAAMEKALSQYGIIGAVHNTDTTLTDAVKEMIESAS